MGSLFGAAPSNAAQGPASSMMPRSASFGSQGAAKPSFSFGAPSGTQNTSTQAGSLFGAQPQENKTSGFSFGGSSNAQQGSLAPTNTSTQPNQARPSLFGAQPQQQQQQSQPQQGGLFGAAPQQQQTGLFGSQAQNSQQPQQQSGLFGASKPAGGLFGNQAGGSSSSLFAPAGTNPASNAQQGGGGLFGNTQPNTAQQKPGSLFGGQHSNTFGGFGASQSQGFGASAGAPSASGSALLSSQMAQNVSPLLQYPYHQRERFNELPEQQRLMLDEMEKYIASQTRIERQMRARNASVDITSLTTEIREVDSLVQALGASIEADQIRLQAVVQKVEQDRNDDIMLYEVAQHAKEHAGDGSSYVHWLRRFYERAATDYVARVQRYRATMEQIERHLISLDQPAQTAPQMIAEAIHDQNAAFMALAEQVATLHAEIDALKKDYAKWYRERFNSVRDPFQGAAASEHS